MSAKPSPGAYHQHTRAAEPAGDEAGREGAEVIDCLKSSTVVAGMSTGGGYFHGDGTPLKMDSVYSVLTTDYLYAREDYCYQHLDPNPYITGLGYSQPTIEFLESLNTSPADPLDDYLDHEPRR